jgi:choline dehydrogenase-like flavoprotein
VIRYDLAREDPARVRVGLRRLEQLFLAFHPLGTARADARASRGVVDGDLAVHGTRGVYVADGPVVPSALGVNPQVTIMVLATRLAFGLMERSCPS